jgi:hypothetical protein
VQAQLDLHGLRRDEAREQLAAFLREAGRHGLRCVRIIHGKGQRLARPRAGAQGQVKAWLVQKHEVLAFTQARGSDGGHGALIVLFQPWHRAAQAWLSPVDGVRVRGVIPSRTPDSRLQPSIALSSSAYSTGFTRCASKPASSVARLSSSWP